MTTILSIGQYYLERHYDQGSSRAQGPTPFGRLRHNLFTIKHATVVPGASGEGR